MDWAGGLSFGEEELLFETMTVYRTIYIYTTVYYLTFSPVSV